jgi:hypothetical protein
VEKAKRLARGIAAVLIVKEERVKIVDEVLC